MTTSIVLTSMGHFHPHHRIPNEFFDSLGIESSAHWIEERTGIKNRFSVLPPAALTKLRHGQRTYAQMRHEGNIPSLAGMSIAPWRMLRERAELSEDFQPDLLICGTSVPDFDIPANAAMIAAELKLDRTMVFDVNSACSSFVTDLRVAASLLQTTSLRSAAIFNVERYTLRLDYSDRRNCVLFGDGAACALLQKVPSSGPSTRGLELVDCRMHSDVSGAEVVQIPVGGHFSQVGARVQRFAIGKTCEVSNELLRAHNLSVDDISYFVGHQANLRMLESCAEKLGFSAVQHLYNVDTHGNQGAAGAPAVLSQHWSRFKSGDLILVAVVGSGLTWGGALLRVT